MFYGIKNGKVFIISEEKTNLKVDEWIESKIENGVYENGKIIPKEESEEYKKQLEELKQKQLQEKIKKLQEEGYNVDEEGNIIKDERWLEVEIQKINSWFDQIIKDYIKDYPEMEVQTWAIKLAEAEKVLAGGTSEYLQKLADDKQIDVNELAQKIKTKADIYNDLYSKLEAEKDKKIEALKQSLENNN